MGCLLSVPDWSGHFYLGDRSGYGQPFCAAFSHTSRSATVALRGEESWTLRAASSRSWVCNHEGPTLRPQPAGSRHARVRFHEVLVRAGDLVVLAPVCTANWAAAAEMQVIRGTITVTPDLAHHIGPNDRLIIKLYHLENGVEMDAKYQIVPSFSLPYAFLAAPSIDMMPKPNTTPTFSSCSPTRMTTSWRPHPAS
jgi:hypothetical protein